MRLEAFFLCKVSYEIMTTTLYYHNYTNIQIILSNFDEIILVL